MDPTTEGQPIELQGSGMIASVMTDLNRHGDLVLADSLPRALETNEGVANKALRVTNIAIDGQHLSTGTGTVVDDVAHPASVH